MATSATYGVAHYGDSQYGVVFVAGDTGAYTLTGGAASFKYDHATQAVAGSYAITGGDAGLLVGHILGADAGSYALTGYSSTLIRDEVVYAGAFAFHFTGNDAALTASHILTAEVGAYSVTGGSADLTRSLIFSVDAGAYACIGKDAILQASSVATEIVTTGGLPKKVKTKIKKNQRDEVEAIVREAFDKMDGTYVPEPVVEKIQKEAQREIKRIDLGEYDAAMAQINALLLTAKLKIQEYESELDDENALLLLL